MNIQERKRYTLIVFVLYIVFFFLYSGLGLWGYLDGTSLFPDFPSLVNAILTVLVIGFGGGWLVAGIVGGIWLVCRFIGKQKKRVIVLACIFFPFTLWAFAIVGFIVAIPFSIYNAVLLRRIKKSDNVASS